jgi:hypothetical protein
MTRILTFDYDHSYHPAAPHIEIIVDGYDSEYEPVTLIAFADSGADGTMLPQDILEAVGAEYADTVVLRGPAGGVQHLDRYTVRIRIADEIVHGIEAAATVPNGEPILGRDVLNAFIITLNGPANVTEISLD